MCVQIVLLWNIWTLLLLQEWRQHPGACRFLLDNDDSETWYEHKSDRSLLLIIPFLASHYSVPCFSLFRSLLLITPFIASHYSVPCFSLFLVADAQGVLCGVECTRYRQNACVVSWLVCAVMGGKARETFITWVLHKSRCWWSTSRTWTFDDPACTTSPLIRFSLVLLIIIITKVKYDWPKPLASFERLTVR